MPSLMIGFQRERFVDDTAIETQRKSMVVRVAYCAREFIDDDRWTEGYVLHFFVPCVVREKKI